MVAFAAEYGPEFPLTSGGFPRLLHSGLPFVFCEREAVFLRLRLRPSTVAVAAEYGCGVFGVRLGMIG